MSDVSPHATAAAEVKQQLLDTAKEMLTSGLVQGTAGNVAARLPDGNVVLTPSSLDYLHDGLSTISSCATSTATVVEGHRGPTTEKVLHLSALRRYPGDQRDDALPRQALHDVRARPASRSRR